VCHNCSNHVQIVKGFGDDPVRVCDYCYNNTDETLEDTSENEDKAKEDNSNQDEEDNKPTGVFQLDESILKDSKESIADLQQTSTVFSE